MVWHGGCYFFYEIPHARGLSRCNGGHLLTKKAAEKPLFF